MTDVAADLSLVPTGRLDSLSSGAIASAEPTRSEVDGALAARIVAGDAEAFKAMFKAHFDDLHAYAVALTQDQDLADECVQAVMYKVWTLGTRWRPSQSIRAYLVVALRNHISGRRKRERVVRRWEALATLRPEVSGIGQGPEPTDAACRRHEISAALYEVLRHLPERRRVAVTLRYQYHMTNPEIAEMMGISIKGVERHIMMALRTLRARLKGFI
jgi:RNA polymerase sigma-70 factor, ECF subfamily